MRLDRIDQAAEHQQKQQFWPKVKGIRSYPGCNFINEEFH